MSGPQHATSLMTKSCIFTPQILDETEHQIYSNFHRYFSHHRKNMVQLWKQYMLETSNPHDPNFA